VNTIKHERPPPYAKPSGEERVRNARCRMTRVLNDGGPVPESTLHMLANVVHAVADIVEQQQKLGSGDSRQPEQAPAPLGPLVSPPDEPLRGNH
jgi:hypothetical protein